MASASTRQQRSERRAAKAGLTYVNDFDAGIQRKPCGRGFTYIGSNGKRISAKATRERIDALAIPPAWTEVWICSDNSGHIQARGRDDAGRIQYIYHDDWERVSTARKFDRMALFGELLPKIRRRVRKDLNRNGLGRLRVIAAVVRLLDKAHLRIGNEQSVNERGARGATTLSSEHVDVEDVLVSLEFPGKSGQLREVEFRDAKVAQVIARCEEIDGQFLFCYQDKGEVHSPIESTDVNAYLKELSDKAVTAKDFRTWWGSVTALASLAELTESASAADRKKACVAAVKLTAETLGNTPAVCRSSYIHPAILAAATSGELPAMLHSLDVRSDVPELAQDEVRFNQLLPSLDFS